MIFLSCSLGVGDTRPPVNPANVLQEPQAIVESARHFREKVCDVGVAESQVLELARAPMLHCKSIHELDATLRRSVWRRKTPIPQVRTFIPT